MGIEPTAQAWEAWVLPLYDARYAVDSSRVPAGRQIGANRGGPAGSGTGATFTMNVPTLDSWLALRARNPV
jgi:hypothetical protein